MELLVDPPPQIDVDEEFRSLPAYAQHAALLYFRCRKFKELELPQAGGLEQQNELLMQMLEVAHDTYMEIQLERDEARASAIQSRAAGVGGENLHIGRRYSRRRA